MITRSSSARGRRIYGRSGIYNRRPMRPLPNFGRARWPLLCRPAAGPVGRRPGVRRPPRARTSSAPRPARPSNAKDIDTLYKIVFALGAGVIALVWGVLFYSLFRFRARRGRTAPQIRGNTPLELGWTIGASALVIVARGRSPSSILRRHPRPRASGPAALASVRGQNAVIDQPPPPDDKGIKIKVSGQQYLWRYQYPNGAFSFDDMVVPKDTTVTLEDHLQRRRPQLVDPEAGRKDGRAARAHQRDLVQGRPRPASSRASAPSSAASTTPT